MEIEQAHTDKPKTNTVRFIGLETTDTHLLTCNSNGTLTWTPLDDKELVVITTLDKTTTTGGSTIAGAGTDLTILRAHPIHRHLLAVAGKDIDVQIYDMNVILSGTSTKKSTELLPPTPTPSKSTSTRTVHPRQRQKPGKVGLIHEAKNVKNDYLDLPQPVWVHDLQFMNETGTQVAVATHYHQIRLYDFTKARRPVLTVDVGKVPLTSLSVGKDYDHVVFADTRNDVGMFNIRNGKVVAQLKGFAGACKATLTVPSPTFTTTNNTKGSVLASVALDRTLRLHELDTKFRKLDKKVYLKQRLTAILVDTDYVVPEPTVDDEEEKEDEELWNTMETVKQTKRPRLANK
ncbi:hypothetical protein BC941DRAFT_343350 [Chlamydoabsidia padenii]|nr:hypothetical protein BC941DRAFT_343350 [Chlamydoabsidia padenii]